MRRVIANTNCPSLRALKQFGIETNYQTLKAYYNENRTLPEELFNDLCRLSDINRAILRFKIVEENWGQKLGGKR